MPGGKNQMESYPRETLLRLLEAYSRLYIAVDGFWYLAVKGEFGNDKALEHDVWVWGKMCKREVEAISEALGVKERDVAAFFQVFTMTPWFRKMEYETELKGDGAGILTILRCPTLIALEQEGEGRERSICQGVDVDYFKRFAGCFNRDLEVTPKVIPPREEKKGICCQWEVRLVGKG
jgi:hypothetical protein